MVSLARKDMKFSDLSKARRIFLLCLVSAGSSIIYTPAYLKGVFYDPLMQALGCTNADLGGLLAAYSIVAMVCYLPAGVLADKIRVRTLSWVGMVTTAVFTFWYAALPSLTLLYCIFIGMGFTTILIWWGTRYKLVRLISSEDSYPSQIGMSYSIYGVAGLIVGLINTAIVSSVASATQSMSILLIFLGCLILVLGILSFFLIPNFEGEIQKDAKMFSLSEAAKAFKNPGVIWAAVAMFFIYAVYQGVTYTTPFMTACFSAPIALVSIVGLIRTYGIGLLAGPAAGGLAKIMKSPSKAIMCFLVASIVVLAAFLMLPRNEAMVVAVATLVVLVGFISYGCFSIGSSTLTEAKVPLPIFGAATGILSVVGFLPDTFLHTWFGSMIDAKGVDAYNTIFMVLIGFAALGLFAAWQVRRAGLHAQAQRENEAADELVQED
ncbi:MAG: MFS transporter [Eggerthellaceae bacterium]|jgi:predicted MFS family arabinose efflux permease|nr:MFS transporter [Eggerthellaceae bacterium]MDR2722081.1 MFS transporter [Coriobacteriaceae bacterium]